MMLREILAAALGVIVPIRHDPYPPPAANVRAAVAVNARRSRASRDHSHAIQENVRRSMRPIDELLREMGGCGDEAG